MSSTALLNVLVIGDNRLHCQGVAHLLEQDRRCCAIGVALNAYEALELLALKSADIALVDAAMLDGIELMRTIAAMHTTVKVVALGVDEDRDDMILYAEAGAAGYVPRAASVNELVSVMQSIEHGELPCSPRMAATLLRRVGVLAARTSAHAGNGVRTLTRREREIVQLLGLRMSNKQIGGRLGIEAATVKNHVHRILEKLHAHRRSDIISLLH
jgi:DNA-binding NarL/FixJ family response regulator